jgi:tetratricopeptide (TPR) repeat protein
MIASKRLHLAAAVLCFSLLSTAPFAAGPPPDSPGLSPELKEIGKLVKAGEYEAAIPRLKAVLKDEPDNADALNWLGFSNRKLGRFDSSLDWYMKALASDPDHLGANEYLGELYVQTGEMDKADEQLKKLESLCPFGCEELDDLKEAIAEAGKQN